MAVIAFVGSVFSPYYAWARRRGGGEAQNHCALNVALYRRPAGSSRFERLWAMTERGSAAVQRRPDEMRIGPSRVAWVDDRALQIDVDEWTAPWPQRLRGRITVQTGALPERAFALDAAGRHVWQPISPAAAVSVNFDQPRLRWQGEGYLDANVGSRPLACDFNTWHWSRAALPEGRSAVVYDVHRKDGSPHALALRFDAAGRVQAMPAPPLCVLPASDWGLLRLTRGAPATQLAALEDGPFYSRSLVKGVWDGEPVNAVHESLSLTRFEKPWVQALLPVRMPRRGSAGG